MTHASKCNPGWTLLSTLPRQTPRAPFPKPGLLDWPAPTMQLWDLNREDHGICEFNLSATLQRVCGPTHLVHAASSPTPAMTRVGSPSSAHRTSGDARTDAFPWTRCSYHADLGNWTRWNAGRAFGPINTTPDIGLGPGICDSGGPFAGARFPAPAGQLTHSD